MSTYEQDWDCCGSTSTTEAWEPERCPFCEVDTLKAALDAERAASAGLGERLGEVLMKRDEALQQLADVWIHCTGIVCTAEKGPDDDNIPARVRELRKVCEEAQRERGEAREQRDEIMRAVRVGGSLHELDDEQAIDCMRARMFCWDDNEAKLLARTRGEIAARRECDRLSSEVERLAADNARLRRVLAVERGDETQAPEGWAFERDYEGHGWVKGEPYEGRPWSRVDLYTGFTHDWGAFDSDDAPVAKGDAESALEAMEAADAARTPVERLVELLGDADVTVQFGLVEQGHVPTIERMLADGEDWAAIGKAIGWCPDTAKRHWQWRMDAEAAADAESTP